MRIATMYRPATTYTANGRRKPHRVQAKMVCAHKADKKYHRLCHTHECDGTGVEHHQAAAEALLKRLKINGTVQRGKDYSYALGWDVLTSQTKTAPQGQE